MLATVTEYVLGFALPTGFYAFLVGSGGPVVGGHRILSVEDSANPTESVVGATLP